MACLGVVVVMKVICGLEGRAPAPQEFAQRSHFYLLASRCPFPSGPCEDQASPLEILNEEAICLKPLGYRVAEDLQAPFVLKVVEESPF